ncbi:MFS transporter [Salinibacterium sp. G-O1]|uniref:MFS transporter n=1 Tax=Salinibacterium sp. G-O1 TaxID=3046208 RepID=UPI0024BAC2B7|nr:MFS transporter [Salinibacterium sp. G-O1]MDJ0336559.1 MFS transporter [Salinibacterium sp. G-O1]
MRAASHDPQLSGPFRCLWAATASANLADGTILTLLPLLALTITDAPGEVAAVTVSGTAAWAIFGLPGGWLVDVVDRRRLLVVVNVSRALLLLTLMAVWSVLGGSLPILISLALLLGMGEVLADSSFTALVPEVVPPVLRGRANARIETTINVLNQLAGPPLAGLLLGFGVIAASGLPAALYLLAVPALLLMGRRAGSPRIGPRDRGRRHAKRGAWHAELTSGIRLLWRIPMLRSLTVLTAGMNLVWATWGALFVIYAVGPGGLGLTSIGYGVLLGGMALGGVLVAPVIDTAVRRVGVRWVLFADLLGTIFLVAPVAAGLGLAPVAIGLTIAGAGATVWRTVVATLRQNLVPQASLGRVYAASRLLSWGVIPIGAAAAGLIAEGFGVRVAFFAAMLVAVSVLCGFLLSLRHTDLEKPYVKAQDEEEPEG